jgi:ribonuclease HII
MSAAPKMICCGIDEAGRGPLAGPVCAASVMLPANFPDIALNDSKKLSAAKRETFTEIICQHALWGVGWASPEEIDAINILQATLLAMQRAFRNMHILVDRAYIDGNICPSLPIACEAVIKGDEKIRSIMAASIIAKTLRDRYMKRLAFIEGRYNFEKHKGYPTKQHREEILRYGITPYHRKSFCQKIIGNKAFRPSTGFTD